MWSARKAPDLPMLPCIRRENMCYPPTTPVGAWPYCRSRLTAVWVRRPTWSIRVVRSIHRGPPTIRLEISIPAIIAPPMFIWSVSIPRRRMIADEAGLDQILIFKLDLTTGKLAPVSQTPSLPGSAPRHLCSDPAGRAFYQLRAGPPDANELYAFDPSTGKLTPWGERFGSQGALPAAVWHPSF